jgi:16S rRNA G966 N2-methylase RsmD
MIKRIKNLVRRHFDNQDKILRATKIVYASQKLDKLFEGKSFIPFTKWSMAPNAILHILNMLEFNKNPRVIEFGSGATTLFLAQYFHISKTKQKLISIESDVAWINVMAEKLAILGLSEYVEMIHAPIREVAANLRYKNQNLWYDTNSIKSLLINDMTFDLVIVDGPPGIISPYARFSVFPFLKEYTNNKTIWLLDDTDRAVEREIVNEWGKLSTCSVYDYDTYSILMNKAGFDSQPII